MTADTTTTGGQFYVRPKPPHLAMIGSKPMLKFKREFVINSRMEG